MSENWVEIQVRGESTTETFGLPPNESIRGVAVPGVYEWVADGDASREGAVTVEVRHEGVGISRQFDLTPGDSYNVFESSVFVKRVGGGESDD